MNKIRLILLLPFVISIFYNSKAEDDFILPFNVGIYGGFNFNLHSPDFLYPLVLPIDTNRSINQEVNFNENSTSIGINIGGIVNMPINKNFVFSGRIGYHTFGVDLEKTSSNPDVGQLHSNIDASLNYLEISSIMQFHNLFSEKKLYVLAGLEFGIPLAKNFQIINSWSENGQTAEGFNYRSDIPETNVRVALALGAGYIFKLENNKFLMPEISVRLPFTKVSANDAFDSWAVPQIRMGVNFTFGFEKEKPAPPESSLEVGFNSVSYFDKDGTKNPLKKIKVEEVQYKELFPLIPYIFTAQNSPFPSEKTQKLAAERETGEFVMDQLSPDAMEINESTLDIIGNRMRNDENANLTITGTTDGEEDTDGLSGKRAEFAKNYLVINYGIDTKRITTNSRELPDNPSAVNDPDGIAENRRIEFRSNDQTILEPIIIEKDRQSIAEPDLIEFDPFAKSTDSIVSWEFVLSQAGKIIKIFKGTGLPNPINWTILPDELKASEIPVEYSFSAESAAGLTDHESGSVPVEFFSFSRKQTEERADRTISKFSLIVFPFDKAEVSDYDREIIEKNVIPAINYKSTVQIYGYTDRIGDEEYNRKLALRRAETVKDILQAKAKSAKYEVYGVGEKVAIFDNDNPIGRQLSRTVQIYIITPKE